MSSMRISVLSFLVLNLLAVVGIPPALAHGKEYTAPQDCLAGPAPYHCSTTLCGINVVCFDSGHIQPNAAGMATITISDTIVSPASLLVCQGPCAISGPDILAIGCGSVTINRWSDSHPWDISRTVFVIPLGPGYSGLPLLGGGLCDAFSAPTTGAVTHS